MVRARAPGHEHRATPPPHPRPPSGILTEHLIDNILIQFSKGALSQRYKNAQFLGNKADAGARCAMEGRNECFARIIQNFLDAGYMAA